MQTKEERIKELAEILDEFYQMAEEYGLENKDEKNQTVGEAYAEKILNAGYTKSPIKLTLISDEEINHAIKELKVGLPIGLQATPINLKRTIAETQLAHNEQEVAKQLKR